MDNDGRQQAAIFLGMLMAIIIILFFIANDAGVIKIKKSPEKQSSIGKHNRFPGD
jgi:hypothetical protein